MTAAWKLIEDAKPNITCYGCGGHAVNLLASDVRKIPVINGVLQMNQNVSKFFKAHSIAKQVLQQVTKEKYGKSLNTVISCATRWSTDYFMVRRNLRIRSALLCAVVDDNLSKELKATQANQKNSEVKTNILDDTFWLNTQKVHDLLKPLSVAIRYSEGDNVPVSIMPRLWGHIETYFNKSTLLNDAWEETEVATLTESFERRKEMNTRPVTLAAYTLDPRFHDDRVSVEEWKIASNFIVDFAQHEGHSRLDIISDLADYRAKTGLFSDPLLWEAVHSESCRKSPERWWMAFAARSSLKKIAVSLLSMPATAAIVERCNKAYANQKTKSRNRLMPERAAKLAVVSYNLAVNRKIPCTVNASESQTKRAKAEVSILALFSTRAPDYKSAFTTVGAAGDTGTIMESASGKVDDTDDETEVDDSFCEDDTDHSDQSQFESDASSLDEDDVEVSMTGVDLMKGITLLLLAFLVLILLNMGALTEKIRAK